MKTDFHMLRAQFFLFRSFFSMLPLLGLVTGTDLLFLRSCVLCSMFLNSNPKCCLYSEVTSRVTLHIRVPSVKHIFSVFLVYKQCSCTRGHFQESGRLAIIIACVCSKGKGVTVLDLRQEFHKLGWRGLTSLGGHHQCNSL